MKTGSFVVLFTVSVVVLAAGCSANSLPQGAGTSGTSGSGGSGSEGASGAVSGSGSGTSSGTGSGAGGGGSGAGSGSTGSDGGNDSGAGSALDSSAGTDTGRVDDGGEGGTPPDSGSDAGRAKHTGVFRIVPLGDSITGSMCPPQLLSQQLIGNARTNFVFVGSNLNNQSCFGAPNVRTEGHGGYLVTDLVGAGIHAAELPRWCSTDKADIVLMLFGTNDAWQHKPTQFILDAYSVVLTDLRGVNPDVIVFVGKITPLHPTGCATCEAAVEALNAQIPAWASSHNTAASPVFVVDVNSAFIAADYLPGSAYTADGVHPNPAGSKLIADKWYKALVSQGLP